MTNAIKQGCKTPESILEFCNSTPGCCSCFLEMDQMIEEHNSSNCINSLQQKLTQADLLELAGICFPALVNHSDSIITRCIGNTIHVSWSKFPSSTYITLIDGEIEVGELQKVPVVKIYNFFATRNLI